MVNGLTNKIVDVSWFKIFLILFLYLLSVNHKSKSQNVVINEVMSLNSSAIEDEFGDYSDWIELYNTTSDSLDLTGYHLSDDPGEPDKWTFPNIVIEPHGFLLIFASGRDTTGTVDPHASFKISSEGETIVLSNVNETVIDELQVIKLERDLSFGRTADGGMELETFYVSSPKFSNIQNSILNNLSVSYEPGFYTHDIQLAIISSQGNNNVNYTSDGSEPTSESPIYNSPLTLTSRDGENYIISEIPTTPLTGPWQLEEFIWKKPGQSVNMVNVIRFRSFSDNLPTSNIISGTYFIGNGKLTGNSFPIISIIIGEENLFDYDSGIYIPGKRYDLNGWDWHPDGNYMNNGIDWERKGYAEFYEPDGSLGFSQDCGIRIHGGWSAKMPQKSLRLIARDIYGDNRFSHQIFPGMEDDSFKDFVLRNSGNDFIYSHIRDAFMQELLSDLDLELQAFRPAVVFINGEYWGFHGIRERYDDDYFKRHFNIDEDELIVVGVCGEPETGDNSSYTSMMDFIRNNNLSVESNYDSVQQMIEIPNFIDYQIAQIFYANSDWPDNNFKMWKTTGPSSKWRCLTYDLDGGFGFFNFYDYNMLEQLVDPSNSSYNLCSTEIFRSLLENNNFREQFINRFVYHLQTTFFSDTVVDIINKYQKLLEREMVDHINRWGYPKNTDQWKVELQIMKDYAKYRPCFCVNHLMEVFDLKELDFYCNENNFPKEDEQLQIEVFPNPANEHLYVKIKKFDQEEYIISLFNINGQNVIKKSIRSGRYETSEIRVRNLMSGLYILSVTDGYSTINKKIIIE